MTVQTLKVGGKSFVIVPEKEFRKLQARAEQITQQDRGDLAESRRRMKEPGGKTLAQIQGVQRERADGPACDQVATLMAGSICCYGNSTRSAAIAATSRHVEHIHLPLAPP